MVHSEVLINLRERFSNTLGNYLQLKTTTEFASLKKMIFFLESTYFVFEDPLVKQPNKLKRKSTDKEKLGLRPCLPSALEFLSERNFNIEYLHAFWSNNEKN